MSDQLPQDPNQQPVQQQSDTQLKSASIRALDDTWNQQNKQRIQNNIGAALDPSIAGDLNRTLDNPEAMQILRQQQLEDREQDNKSLLLTGIVTALGGLFGGAIAGDAGSAAGLQGGITGAAAGQQLQNSMADNRLKEEQIDSMRRDRLGILSTKERLQVANLSANIAKEQGVQDRFYQNSQQRQQSIDLGKQNYALHAQGQNFSQNKQLGDINADWNKRLDKDSVYSKATTSESQADNMLNLVSAARNGTALAGSALKRAAARAAGEVGVLTDADIAQFGGLQSIQNRIERWGQLAATGQQLTGDDLNEFEKLATAMKTAAQKRKQESINRMAPKFAAERGVSQDQVKSVIQPGSTPTSSISKEQAMAELQRRKAGK